MDDNQILAPELYSRLAPKYQGGMLRYIERGIIPGSFLMNVLANDLMQSFSCMDSETSAQELRDLVGWIYNFAPGGCHGSMDKLSSWAQRQRSKWQNEPGFNSTTCT